ncbi:ATP-binding protein [Haloferula chungangensis]|uniref:histidine kinase n=1 Tax=Haloferula chungangensis TaxID=1048331 RepID=A0ABW2L8G1_9BACT
MISIRWRLTASLCLTVALLFAVAGFGVFLAMKDALRARFDETLTAKARALITASEIDDGDFEIDLTVQDFAGFGKSGDDYFEIRRLDGGPFLRSPSLGWSAANDRGFAEIEQPHDESGRIGELTLGDGRSARYYVQRIYPKDDAKQRFQDLYLIVASPTRGMEVQLRLLGTVLSIVGAVVLLLMVPLIRFGLRSGLRPLEKMAGEIREIRSDELDQRLDVAGLPPELEPMAVGLNGWLARLEESFARERRFTSHAAHELRTPLAELRALAELGAMDASGADAENYAGIVAVSAELGALLDKLALLARADAGSQPVEFGKIELASCLHAEIKRLETSAEKRGIIIESDIEDGEFVTDPVLWQTIVRNLLGNAVAYAPEGSTVELVASVREFSLRNPAPGMEKSDLDHLFERFWRKDHARAGYGHSGLGLAIVQASCSLLGADCQASLGPGDWLEMKVVWRNTG